MSAKHAIVVGLGFGDEGKGATVDYLTATRKYDMVVRFNGGQQAGHNVITPDGLHHTFSQIGAGFFNDVPSHTSGYCTFDPIAFKKEADALFRLTRKNAFRSHTVAPDALVTTHLHQGANMVREARRGDSAHGTVGVGFGETIRYALAIDNPIQVRDLLEPDVLGEKLIAQSYWLSDQGIMEHPVDNPEIMVRELCKYAPHLRLQEDSDIDFENQRVVFEGAQGALLDEWYGFHPHTTWSTTTPHNAQMMVKDEDSEVVGCTRTYHTRHGAGPMQVEGKFTNSPREAHNTDDGAQGAWRTGGFSLPLFRYALAVTQPDVLSVSFADVHAPGFEGQEITVPTTPIESEPERLAEQEAIGKGLNNDSLRYTGEMSIERLANYVPVKLSATGPNRRERVYET